MTCPDAHASFAHFDHNAPNHRACAEEAWQQLRSTAGIPRSEAHGGFYVFSRYDDVAEAAIDWEIYSSGQGIAVPDLHFDERLVPIEYDPPRQREYRKLITKFLTPAAVAAHEAAIRRVAISLLEKLDGVGHTDFVESFARPYPILAALEILGFPAEDASLLDHLINTSIGGRGNDAALAAAAQLTDYIAAYVSTRQAADDAPDDIISAIVSNTRNDVAPLSTAEQISYVRLLLFGGFTTTTFAISSAIRWLAEHPTDRAQLQERPELFKTAVDEFVRFSAPGTYLGRTTTHDVDADGTHIPAHSRVLLSYGSANRDQARFERPDEIVLDRNPNPHLGFGMGPHRCIGAHLAKVELTVAIEEIISRLPAFTLDATQEITWMSGETQGMTSLPLIIRR
jgi:cytochrome P450